MSGCEWMAAHETNTISELIFASLGAMSEKHSCGWNRDLFNISDFSTLFLLPSTSSSSFIRSHPCLPLSPLTAFLQFFAFSLLFQPPSSPTPVVLVISYPLDLTTLPLGLWLNLRTFYLHGYDSLWIYLSILQHWSLSCPITPAIAAFAGK